MPLTCYRGLFVGDFWAKLSECFSKDLGPQKFNSLSYHKGHLGGFWVGLWPSRPSHPFLAHFVVLQPIRLDHLTPKHFFFEETVLAPIWWFSCWRATIRHLGVSEHQAYDGMTPVHGDTPVLLMGPYQPKRFKIEAGHPLEVSTLKNAYGEIWIV